MKGRGWRVWLEEERVCEGGVGGKEGCERVWLEEERGVRGWGWRKRGMRELVEWGWRKGRGV